MDEQFLDYQKGNQWDPDPVKGLCMNFMESSHWKNCRSNSYSMNQNQNFSFLFLCYPKYSHH